jgi:hypothetical protein
MLAGIDEPTFNCSDIGVGMGRHSAANTVVAGDSSHDMSTGRDLEPWRPMLARPVALAVLTNAPKRGGATPGWTSSLTRLRQRFEFLR